MIFDPALNIALQSSLPGLRIPMLLVSILGSAEFYLVVVPILIWCHDRNLGLRILLLVSFSAACNFLLKLAFHAPRPYWISSGVKALAAEPTFGMPSGAAQISLTFLGYIAALFRKPAVRVACIVLVLLVALSRLYLGVHFPGDILAGWIAAVLILILFLHYEQPAAAWLGRRPLWLRVLIAPAVSCLIILAGIAVLAGYDGWQLPAAWSAGALTQSGAAIDPVSLHDLLMAAGVLAGAGAGAALASEYVPYQTNGSRSRKVLRYIVGIFILAILWFALSPLTKAPDPAGPAMTWIRAALTGLWVTAGAPYVFRKTGLVPAD